MRITAQYSHLAQGITITCTREVNNRYGVDQVANEQLNIFARFCPLQENRMIECNVIMLKCTEQHACNICVKNWFHGCWIKCYIHLTSMLHDMLHRLSNILNMVILLHCRCNILLKFFLVARVWHILQHWVIYCDNIERQLEHEIK